MWLHGLLVVAKWAHKTRSFSLQETDTYPNPGEVGKIIDSKVPLIWGDMLVLRRYK